MTEELIKELKNRLRKGEVSFTYTKKDGSARTANGTTKLDMIPENSHPKGGYDTPDDVCRYYDLNSEGWRSFIINNLISIDD